MNSKMLVDAIVRQTTVLIAQLSTSAGIRAPLAHIADQVFLDLSREIEAQGVSRKVAADMFGLAIRTYQKKVQRLNETVVEKDETLWEQVLGYLQTEGSAPRRALQKRFARHESVVLVSVLNDLVSSGLVYKTGSSDSAMFGITREHDLQQMMSEQGRDALASVLWLLIYRSGKSGCSRDELTSQLSIESAELDSALALLVDDQRVQKEETGAEALFRAKKFLVPVDAEHGWEAAVFDQFQAVVRTIGTKLRLGAAKSEKNDVVGGATVGFDVSEGHPYEERAFGLLKRVRDDVNELWDEVEAYNDKNPIPEEDKVEVLFYFGQCVTPADEEQ